MKGERGQAFPLAVMALAAGMLVIAPFLGYASSHLIGSGTYRQGMFEQYAADAGVEYAIWHLQKGDLEVPEFSINDKTVNVDIENKGGQIFEITSTAQSDDGTGTTIQALVATGDYTLFPGKFKLDEGEQYTGNIYAEGNVQLDEGASLTGNVYAGGDVRLDMGAEIAGNVYAEGNVQMDIGARITGTTCAGGDVQLDTEAQIAGDVRVAGNLQLGVQAIIDGDAYVGGNIQMGEGAQINENPYEGCGSSPEGAGITVLTWKVNP